MGSFTDNLTRGIRARRLAAQLDSFTAPNRSVEHLVSAAIMRGGYLHANAKSHASIRTSLGDEEVTVSKPEDEEGFFTSNNRFVTRAEALQIALEAGQVRGGFCRQLLSSDINW